MLNHHAMALACLIRRREDPARAIPEWNDLPYAVRFDNAELDSVRPDRLEVIEDQEGLSIKLYPTKGKKP